MFHFRTTTAAALCLFVSLAVDAAEVRLKKSVQSQGSLVLLGDVAEVKDVDPSVVRQLERIELFPAPTRRQARTLRVREVRELMRLYGVDVQACKFAGADTCRIYARPNDQPVTTGLGRLRRLPAPSKLTRASSSVSETMVVAVRPLNRGAIITAGDVVLEPVAESARKIAGIRGRAIVQQIEDAIGFELTRSINANQPIDARALRRPLMVRRGEVVRVTARAAGVTVRTSARAMQDASHGDVIKLQSTESRQPYLARVTGSQEVEVYASGMVVPTTRQANPRQLGVPVSRVGGRRQEAPRTTARGGNEGARSGALPRQGTAWRPAGYRSGSRNAGR